MKTNVIRILKFSLLIFAIIMYYKIFCIQCSLHFTTWKNYIVLVIMLDTSLNYVVTRYGFRLVFGKLWWFDSNALSILLGGFVSNVYHSHMHVPSLLSKIVSSFLVLCIFLVFPSCGSQLLAIMPYYSL